MAITFTLIGGAIIGAGATHLLSHKQDLAKCDLHINQRTGESNTICFR
jgi:hypothetical protein